MYPRRTLHRLCTLHNQYILYINCTWSQQLHPLMLFTIFLVKLHLLHPSSFFLLLLRNLWRHLQTKRPSPLSSKQDITVIIPAYSFITPAGTLGHNLPFAFSTSLVLSVVPFTNPWSSCHHQLVSNSSKTSTRA